MTPYTRVFLSTKESRLTFLSFCPHPRTLHKLRNENCVVKQIPTHMHSHFQVLLQGVPVSTIEQRTHSSASSGTGHDQTQYRLLVTSLYSVCYGNESASLSVSGEDHYVNIRNLLPFIFKIFLVSIRRWEIQTSNAGLHFVNFRTADRLSSAAPPYVHFEAPRIFTYG
jgi:hypothetical protein